MDNKTTYPELFFLFVAGSVLGFIVEGLWRVIRTGSWENHSATVWGPFCIVYGIGAAGIYFVSGEMTEIPWWEQFLLYALIGAVVEYLASFVQETMFGSVSWDYTGRFMSINGRICLSMTLMWGFLGMVFSYGISPLINRLFVLTSGWPVKGLCIVMSVVIASDLLVSAGALIRWHDRQLDIPSRTIVGERLDERYDDERMEEIYNNMVFIDEPTP